MSLAGSVAAAADQTRAIPEWFAVGIPAHEDPLEKVAKLAASPEDWAGHWQALEQLPRQAKLATQQLRDLLLWMPDPSPGQVRLGGLLEQRLLEQA